MSGPGNKSGNKTGGDKRRRKLLSDDDRALWDLVASRLEPARGKSRVRDVEPDMDALDALAAEIDALREKSLLGAGKRDVAPARLKQATTPPLPSTRAPTKAPPPQPRLGPQLVKLERRKARRIARGSEEIEARLDLHGMTQDDAHATLVGFVRRCHANGLRRVLVITGKGGTGRHHADDEVIPRPRGVLKHNVPRWLGGAEIGALVVSYTTAHVRHGGEGALYVQLRRND